MTNENYTASNESLDLIENFNDILREARTTYLNSETYKQKVEEDEKVYFLETRRELYPLMLISSLDKR